VHAYSCGAVTATPPSSYQVDRSLDGHSFANRRVVAIQHGQQIFTMAASFQASEAGFDHQIAMPPVPPPESLADTSGPPGALLARLPERVRRFFEQPRPFEFRMVQSIDYLHPQRAPPERQICSAPSTPWVTMRCCTATAGVRVGFFLLDTATCRTAARS